MTSKSYFSDEEFSGINFTVEEPIKADYENCRFLNCKFPKADLSEFGFIECEFSGCDLS
ncbi:MAG TPA: hypothetical protein DD671_16490, partial [Balneolaceae bacterium]|nr:hypothetical protein [Balneolaceae bacterium]